MIHVLGTYLGQEVIHNILARLLKWVSGKMPWFSMRRCCPQSKIPELYECKLTLIPSIMYVTSQRKPDNISLKTGQLQHFHILVIVNTLLWMQFLLAIASLHEKFNTFSASQIPQVYPTHTFITMFTRVYQLVTFWAKESSPHNCILFL
jgi:hypothetical protein